MLRIDIRDLRQGPVRTEGQIPAADPLFGGLSVPLVGPLVVSGVLETTSGGDFLWRGRFAGQIQGTCRRCLRELVLEVEESVEALFADMGAHVEPGAAEAAAYHAYAAHPTRAQPVRAAAG